MSTTREKVLKLLGKMSPCVVVEIGAHVGGDTRDLWFAAGGAHSWYLAVEPDPRNAAGLRHNLRDRRIRFLEAAVSDLNGLAMFSGTADPNTASGSIKKPVLHLTQHPTVHFPDKLKTIVPTITLDTIVEAYELTKIDMLWADVQGAEDLMIAGGQKALAMTKWLHTEFYNDEVYENQLPLDGIMSRLPGEWEVVEIFADDALIRNKAF